MFRQGAAALRAIGFVVAGVAAATLGACSSAAPTEADIKQAMLGNEQVMAGFRSAATFEKTLTGRSTSPEDAISESTIEIQSCVSGADGFVCTFRVTRPAPKCDDDVYVDGTSVPCPSGQPITGTWGKARFFRAASGWQIMAAQ